MQGSYTSIFNTHKKKYENGSATFDVRFYQVISQFLINKRIISNESYYIILFYSPLAKDLHDFLHDSKYLMKNKYFMKK